MHKNTWKAGERRIAVLFNTYRTPLSGGSSRHTRSDTLHTDLFIEVKHRKRPPADNLWLDVVKKAKLEKKTPLIVFIKKGCPNPLILCMLKDIQNIKNALTMAEIKPDPQIRKGVEQK